MDKSPLQPLLVENAEEFLKRMLERERMMIENSINLICSVDREGRFVTVNPAYLKVLGYHPEELIGRLFVNYVAPEDVQRSVEAAAKVMAGDGITGFEKTAARIKTASPFISSGLLTGRKANS